MAILADSEIKGRKTLLGPLGNGGSLMAWFTLLPADNIKPNLTVSRTRTNP
jgi:hypothetical protein